MSTFLEKTLAPASQARQRIPQTHTEEREVGSTDTASPRSGHDFNQVPLLYSVLGAIQAKPAINSSRDEVGQSVDAPKEMKADSICPPVAAGLRLDFTRIPVTGPLIQCKLTVNSPGSPDEREADEVADKMARMAGPAPIDSAPAAIPRKCLEGHGEERKTIQTRRTPCANAEPALGVEAAVRAAERVGVPLPRDVRNYFEPRFGHDFSAVRVHADGEAADGARAVRARAYTIGRDIVFGSGQYAPATMDGRRLLAHELVHVVQQAAGAATSTQSVPDVQRGEPNGAAIGTASFSTASLQLRSAPVAIQRKASADDVERAEKEHRATQQRVYQLLEPDTRWDYIRRGASPPGSLSPEQKAKDPHVIFNNSVAWIRARRIVLTVLTPVPGQSDSEPRVTLFDPSVNYPAVGGSVDNTIDLEKNVGAVTHDKSMQLVVNPGFTETRLRELLRHEIQHVADAHTDPDVSKQEQAEFQAEQPTSGQSQGYGLMNASIWNKYETEFRAHWLESIARPGRIVGVREDGTPVEQGGSGGVDRFGSDTGPGGELKVSGHDNLKSNPLYVPEAAIQLSNEKQTKIARHIVRNYFGMEETFLTSPIFRSKIQNLTRPEGLNLVNSLRIERLHRAIHRPATRTSLWPGTVSREQDVTDAVKSLDDTDLAFLKDRGSSKPFWDDARKQLSSSIFTWMENYILQGKNEVPPPIPQADRMT
jgi:hypothetical protein